MTDPTPSRSTPTESIAFRAETRQLLNILIHSLYTEREIFLRELISNASDALTRMDFAQLTNRDVLNPEAPLQIRITASPENHILTIADSGVGMSADEMVENLGTIAHSGAKAFLEAAEEKHGQVKDLIGQFGVGFYSAFMVADWIRVTSRSYLSDAQAATWYSTGADTFTIEPAEKAERGTLVTLHLNEDASEFLEINRLREIIKRHSDFIAFPIYLGDEPEQVNRQTAIWRQNPRELKETDYDEFYKQLTLDFEAPIGYAHMAVDAPVQMYAILFVPSSPERGMFSARRDEGLKLYARKVLIQEYSKDLLPDYFKFVQGVIDTEDLPLNVSRESVQSNKVMAQLKKLITAKVIETLKKLGQDKPDDYTKFWLGFGQYIKQGVATEAADAEALFPLLRFKTLKNPSGWSSLDDYLQGMKADQKAIYYILGDDERSLMHSPHLDLLRKNDLDVLLLADPLDSFVILRLTTYQEKPLLNAASDSLDLPQNPDEPSTSSAEAAPSAETDALIAEFKSTLGDRVMDIRTTERLSDAPARLVDPEGALKPEMQRVYRMLNKEFEAPKKILEINPRHPILTQLNALVPDSPLRGLVIEQVYEDALLIEGLHPDPSGMIERIQKIMEAALKSA
jgi:molecular chaperone HtpG